jgi:hypothetical protein
MTTYDTGPVGECPLCLGTKTVGGYPCQMCKGLGAIGDSGPAPDRQPGLCGFRIGTDCARSWIGDGASGEYRYEQLELWKAQGFYAIPMDFSDASPLLTKHAQCSAACLFAERREAPRAGSPVIDLTDLPPGSRVSPLPEPPRITAVQIHHAGEDESGSITHVVLTADLDDGTHRECEVRLPEDWTR